MESGRRSKNFTEREKILLIEVAKEFISIIDNKKTDGTSVEAKKQAWMEITNKYNAVSETGNRTEKQLHALYDNLKKKARKNMSDDKSQTYKTGGGTFCPKTTTVDEKVLALLTPQFKHINNEIDSSAPNYNLDNDASASQVPSQLTEEDFLVLLNAKEELVSDTQSTSKEVECAERPISPLVMDVESTPKIRKTSLTEIKKKNIVNISSSLLKRKKKKIINEDVITAKRLEILEIQRQEALEKFEKTKTLLEIDIELKKVLLETAKLDLEFKKKIFNL